MLWVCAFACLWHPPLAETHFLASPDQPCCPLLPAAPTAQQQQRRLADLRSESEELKAQLRQRDAQVADMGAHLEQAGARAAELTAWADRLAAGGDGGGEVWQQERAQLLVGVGGASAAL